MNYLSTLHLSGEDSFEYWREVTRQTYDLGLPQGRKSEFRLAAKMWYAGDLVLSKFRCQPNIKWRISSHLRNDGRPYVKIRRYLSGGATYVADERAFSLRPGATYILNQSRPFSEVSDDNDQLNIFIPRDLLYADFVEKEPVIALDDNTEGGAILRTAIDQLFDVAKTGSAQTAAAIASEFCLVLSSLVNGGAQDYEDSAMVRARQRAIHSLIDKSVTDPTISVEELVLKLPFSRAGLYRHFNGRYGIMHYVRQRRLGIAFEKLCVAQPSRGAVGKIAEAVGYASIHSFAKSFRREFNMTPGSLIGIKTVNTYDIRPEIKCAADVDEGCKAFKDAFLRIRAAG